jgi:transcriptional regulator with XRE-family HTH domain
METQAKYHHPADALRRFMESRDWSQAELAAHFRVSQSAVSRWLSGERVPREMHVRWWLLAEGVDPRCL